MKELLISLIFVLGACGSREWKDVQAALDNASGETAEEQPSESASTPARLRLDPPFCKGIEARSYESENGIESLVLAKCDAGTRLYREVQGEFSLFADCDDVKNFDMYFVQSEVSISYTCGGQVRAQGQNLGEGENPQIASNGSETIVGWGSSAWIGETEVRVTGKILDIRHSGEDFEILSFDEFHSYQVTEVSPEGWVLGTRQVANRDEHPIFADGGWAIYSPHGYGVTINEEWFEAPYKTRLIEATSSAIAFDTGDSIILRRGNIMTLGAGPVHLFERNNGELIVNQGGVRITLN